MITLLIILIVTFIFTAAFFSGSETGIYTLSKLKMRVGLSQNRKTYIILDKLMKDEHGIIFTTLSMTNLSHYLLTICSTALILRLGHSEKTAELYATVLLTPMLFIFSEVLPKNIFFAKADSLMPLFSRLLWIAHKIFVWCGVVPALKFTSRLVSKLIGTQELDQTLLNTAHKQQLAELIKESHEEGLLSQIQSNIIDRMMNISSIKSSDVMLPLASANMINIKTGKTELLEALKKTDCTNWLVYKGANRHIVGYVNIFKLLNSDVGFSELTEHVSPIIEVSAITPAMNALRLMTTKGQSILLVTGTTLTGKSTPQGIITLSAMADQLTGQMQ